MNIIHDENQLVMDVSRDSGIDSGDELQVPFNEVPVEEDSGPVNLMDRDDFTGSTRSAKDTPKSNAPEQDFNGILNSIKSFQEELTVNRKEMENHRELLELLGADTWTKKRQADEQAFLQDMRETFEKDPAKATSTIIMKAQEQLWQAFENRLNEEARQKAAFDRLMNQLSTTPEKASISNFRDEMEFLIRNKGMEPSESIGLIEKIASKFSDINDRKRAVIKKMRSESQLESSQNSNSRNDPDREFTRLMSQARNLDEMFANLRKINR